MGLLLVFTGVAFVITTLLKHYVPRFAGWRFGWLMLASGLLSFAICVVLVSVWAAFK